MHRSRRLMARVLVPAVLLLAAIPAVRAVADDQPPRPDPPPVERVETVPTYPGPEHPTLAVQLDRVARWFTWAAQLPAPSPGPSPGHTGPYRGTVIEGSGSCGGHLPPCWVLARESGGNPGAFNPTGCSGRGCYGKWQCDPRSCDGTGTEAEQDAEAARLWDDGRGCSHWAACG